MWLGQGGAVGGGGGGWVGDRRWGLCQHEMGETVGNRGCGDVESLKGPHWCEKKNVPITKI